MQFFYFVLLLNMGIDRNYAFGLEERFAWNLMEFDWPSEAVKNQSIAKGEYVPESNCPVGIDVWKEKLFMSFPRWKDGVVATLAYINLYDETMSPRLRPYPGWQDHSPKFETFIDPRSGQKRLKNRNAIVSTFRFKVDKCDRLWVIDTGITNPDDPIVVVPPSILIFDLMTDKLIRRIYFDDKVTKQYSFYANIVVDENNGTCNNVFAYAPDLGANGIVIYSFATDKLWRAEHHYFNFDPLQGDYNIHGVRFQWTDGVFSIAISNRLPDGSRTIFFYPLSSTKMFSVSNRVWQNETRATSPDSFDDYTVVGDRGPDTQSTAVVFDELTGVMFFTQIKKDGLTCWNPNTTLSSANFPLIAADNEKMIFLNDVKVEEGGILWTISDNMAEFLYGATTPNKTNYRVFVADSEEFIKGSACAPN